MSMVKEIKLNFFFKFLLRLCKWISKRQMQYRQSIYILHVSSHDHRSYVLHLLLAAVVKVVLTSE